jgi:hypothetical protein
MQSWKYSATVGLLIQTKEVFFSYKIGLVIFDIAKPTVSIQDVTIRRYWWFLPSDKLTVTGINGRFSGVNELN